MELDLVPGRSVGPFSLGMAISEALSIIKVTREISRADIKFNQENPMSSDIFIDLSKDGTLLRFDAVTQRLKVVEVYNAQLVRLRYNREVVCGPDVDATFALIYDRFGSSFPSPYCNGFYYLHYLAGLSFTFPIPAQFKDIYATPDELPFEFPDGSGSPIASRILVYHPGQRHKVSSLPKQPMEFDAAASVGSSTSSMSSMVLSKPALVATVLSGVELENGPTITFDSSVQDVVSLLGEPTVVHRKTEDKMRIHSQDNSVRPLLDYFYNYFDLGFDLLFDGVSHTVKKIVLHTNFPCHYDFNRYTKCDFRIDFPEGYDSEAVGVGHLVPSTSNELLAPAREEPVLLIEEPLHPEEADDILSVFPHTKWSSITRALGEPGKPVVHHRGTVANPFGQTYFFGYKGVVFEIMKNEYIASVCLFRPATVAR